MDLFNISHKLENYIEGHISPADPVLEELSRYTHLKVKHPRMLSGPVQGKLLEMISKMLNPLRILEIGTFTGYSAICLARGLKVGGKIITIEVNDELRNRTLDFFNKAGLQDKIELINGNALEILPSLDERFDLAFLDGEKEEYKEYYELCLPKLRTGGIILADNVLWDGKVLDEPAVQDVTTNAITEFNRIITSDDRVESMIIPIRDGLFLIRKIV